MRHRTCPGHYLAASEVGLGLWTVASGRWGHEPPIVPAYRYAGDQFERVSEAKERHARRSAGGPDRVSVSAAGPGDSGRYAS
jgi:hypothetical protein